VAIVPAATVLVVNGPAGAAAPVASTSSVTVPSTNDLITTVEDAVLGEVYCLVNTILSSPKPTC
jgi:hypothetical protein